MAVIQLQLGSQVRQVENSVWAEYMGGLRGQKYVWVTAHTTHMVPTSRPRVMLVLHTAHTL